MYYTKPYNSPIGPLYLTCSETAITKLSFHGSGAGPEADHPLLDLAFQQLDEYFAGTRKAFTLPLAIEGTRFQKLVYAALQNIGYAKTASYAEIACAIGNPRLAGRSEWPTTAIGLPCSSPATGLSEQMVH